MPTFRQWLSMQRKRDDRVGDLARDVIHDHGFPKEGDLPRFKARLDRFNACSGAYRALEQAWDEYSTQCLGIVKVVA